MNKKDKDWIYISTSLRVKISHNRNIILQSMTGGGCHGVKHHRFTIKPEAARKLADFLNK
jgi:hypothetical protein